MEISQCIVEMQFAFRVPANQQAVAGAHCVTGYTHDTSVTQNAMCQIRNAQPILRPYGTIPINRACVTERIQTGASLISYPAYFFSFYSISRLGCACRVQREYTN